MKIKYIVMSLFPIVCFVCGCVTRNTVKDEPRQTVLFSSQKAAEVFYQAYLLEYYPSQSGNGVSVVIYPPYAHHRHSTDNVYFNAAIRKADCNRDGTISEEEATTYLAYVRQTNKYAKSMHQR
ncbi:MAG: hypothetical protein JWO95_2571 [Verrucomicrobiales bacterium]|nr:hypothetical protein [Verrucomicrobiales bacterium]